MRFSRFHTRPDQTRSATSHQRRAFQQGLSLIECLAALSLIAVVALVAVPSFSRTLENAETASLARRLHISLNYARSTAIAQRQKTVVCGSRGSICEDPANWEHGWIVFVDANNNHRRDGREAILWQQQVSSSSPRLFFRAGAVRNRMVRFEAHGRGWPNGTFFICTEARQLRRIVMYRTGRSRIAAAADPACPDRPN